MNVALILTILLLTVGATMVFYAHVSPHDTAGKTGIAAFGFLILFVVLYAFAAASA